MDFIRKVVEFDDMKITFSIWDTAGAEQFDSISRNLYKNALGVLVVYDLNKNYTTSQLLKWINKGKDEVASNSCFVLVGNKLDLLYDNDDDMNGLEKNNEDTRTKLNNLSKEFNIPYCEISVLNGKNVDLTFKVLIDQVKKVHFDPILKMPNESLLFFSRDTKIKMKSSIQNYKRRISYRPTLTDSMKEKLFKPLIESNNDSKYSSYKGLDITTINNIKISKNSISQKIINRCC